MQPSERIANFSNVPKLGGKKEVVVGSKVSHAVADELTNVAINHDRTMSYLVREFLLRGMAQYYRDGSIRVTTDDETVLAKGRTHGEPQDLGSVDFNPADALRESDDPFTVLSEWYESEGQEIPRDFGMRLFGGWESFSQEKKVDAIKDAKKLLDKTVKPFRQPKNSPKKKEAQKIIDDVELNIPKKKAS